MNSQLIVPKKFAAKFALIDEVIDAGLADPPDAQTVEKNWGLYFWLLQLKPGGKFNSGGRLSKLNFSLGSFVLTFFYWCYYGLYKETLLFSFCMGIISGLVPDNRFLNMGFSIMVSCIFSSFFTQTLYAKCRLTGQSPKGNLFAAIFGGAGALAMIVGLSSLVSTLVYSWLE
ncbi:MAG: hypothetical protein H7Y37_20115 [Anaerolineae bacterium]|nr:hypothetical protein [Gloeobacterales cyanobacterium ES-bin-313]